MILGTRLRSENPPLYRRLVVGASRREYISPFIALEFASEDGSEERDKTPLLQNRKPGKFWIYEQVIKIPFYGIYEIKRQKLAVYHLIDGYYQPLEPNERGHYPIPHLEVELGLWPGNYQNQAQTWLRWWDKQGNLLLTGTERAERAERELTHERELRAQQEQKLQAMAQRLRELGLDPNV